MALANSKAEDFYKSITKTLNARVDNWHKQNINQNQENLGVANVRNRK